MNETQSQSEKEDQHKTASVYFRGGDEVANYELIKESARISGLSFSEHAKEVLSDPLWWLKKPRLFVRFMKETWGPYDAIDTMVKVLGGVPDRDVILSEGEKMSCDELLTGLRAQKRTMRLLEYYEEVWSELYREKMKREHGVSVDEIRL